jgi:hypothetical protein
MFELAFDALILAALYAVAPANHAGRLLVFVAAVVFVTRLVLLLLGRTV